MYLNLGQWLMAVFREIMELKMPSWRNRSLEVGFGSLEPFPSSFSLCFLCMVEMRSLCFLLLPLCLPCHYGHLALNYNKFLLKFLSVVVFLSQQQKSN